MFLSTDIQLQEITVYNTPHPFVLTKAFHTERSHTYTLLPLGNDKAVKSPWKSWKRSFSLPVVRSGADSLAYQRATGRARTTDHSLPRETSRGENSSRVSSPSIDTPASCHVPARSSPLRLSDGGVSTSMRLDRGASTSVSAVTSSARSLPAGFC